RRQERSEVGGDALLADVERPEAPHHVLLRLARRREPVLAVDREVELVRAPVLALPQRVEVLVAHQVAGAAGVARLLVGRVASVGRRDRARGRQRPPVRGPTPRPGAARLHLALARLALELAVVAALGAIDPAA